MENNDIQDQICRRPGRLVISLALHIWNDSTITYESFKFSTESLECKDQFRRSQSGLHGIYQKMQFDFLIASLKNNFIIMNDLNNS